MYAETKEEMEGVKIRDTKETLSDIRKRDMRTLDMQSVVGNKLAMSQQSVNNAENYPSTWTTNPDGGANGQV